MFQKAFFCFIVLCFVASLSASAQTAADTLKQYTGKWAGIYGGNANGKCVITLTKTSDGRLTGKVAVNPSEGEPSEASFQSVTVQGSTFKAVYIIPDADGAQIILEGKRANDKLKGTWQVSTGEAAGTWEATKAP